jgi:hypothetical protein
MSVCVYSVLVLFCVEVETLRRVDPPSKESYRLCIGLGNREKGARAQQRAVEPITYYIQCLLIVFFINSSERSQTSFRVLHTIKGNNGKSMNDTTVLEGTSNPRRAH